MPDVAELARRRKKRKKKKKKKPAAQTPAGSSPPASAPPPAPPTYRWITGWDDSNHDGLVRAVDDGQNHGTPQDPATIPPRPLPAPQNPGAPDPPQPMGTYSGPFGRVEATRLLNRAGFGPKPGQALEVAAMGLDGAVDWLTNPGNQTFSGPAPTDDEGRALAPYDSWGHDHLWWLDRMVRSDQPLLERLALIFHDWFATSNDKVGNSRLMIDQCGLFRTTGFGSFRTLLENVTADPAMIVWLDSDQNRRNSINENYARELMELFSLGANRGAYTEQDVRELARSLTGWDYDWVDDVGATNFRFVQSRWDSGSKTLWADKPAESETGTFNWRDACRLCVENSKHASFFVEKLWSYFVPTPPHASTQAALESIYLSGNYAVRPVIQAILKHPDLYRGAPMVKPPIVYLASLMRASGVYVDREEWVWLSTNAGQRLFYPPNVSGWDDERWLDTNTMRARWLIATAVQDDTAIDVWDDPYDGAEQPLAAFDSALEAWDYPPLRQEQHGELLDYANNAWATAPPSWGQDNYRAARQNALRQLIATCPDMQLA